MGMYRAETTDRYRLRVATTASDICAAQELRHKAFHGKDGRPQGAHLRDEDAFDTTCTHFLIEHARTGELVATLRVLLLGSGADIGESYSAQFYDLDAFRSFEAPMAEVGRFCVAPGTADPDILRMAWGALTTYVDKNGVEMLFGCSSFSGTDESVYADAFAMLRDKYLAPRRFWPKVKAPNVFRFASRLRRAPDKTRALKTMPPLLRSYLTMGGWVSDHAVVDREMNTLHVFTGLEIGRIPPSRARILRAALG